ncbi:MAG TPA: amidohydrolase family protein [Gemmatimonadaceae bacterium]|nr:amidohydrolase family protein [Gemmatimonadaceae bacterium]
MPRAPRRAFVRWLALALALTLVVPPLSAQRGGRAGDSARGQNRLPLTPARSADFTTTKGSWMSLDVSPDGRTIVFDMLGDIYTVPVAGGTATAITHGLAYDAQPRFSPDGSRIVFVSDRSGGDNLWTMRPDGTDTVAVTHGNDNQYVSPRYTPDGRYIVASRGGTTGGVAKLWIYDVRGGNGTALITEPAQLKTLGAAMEPNGRYIWYAQRTGDWTYNAIFPQYELAVYDRETGRSTVTTSRDGSAFRPEISHDGKWLVYGTRYEAKTGLRIRNLETGMERWLAYPVQRDDQESRAPLDVLPGYAFTPDNRAIIASYGGEIWRVPVDGTRATQIPFTAHVAVAMGPEVRFVYRVDDAATFHAHQVRDLAVAPDGRRIAFTALDRVYVIDSIGGVPRRLAQMDTGQFQPAWSPDGRSIAFVTWDDATGGEIYRVDANGGAPERLTTEAAYYRDLAWSPDGRRLVAIRASARDLQENAGTFDGGLNRQLVWVPATGGNATVVMPAGNHAMPQFSTLDTSRIFIYSPADGLISVRWDGTDIKNILRVTQPPTAGAAAEPAQMAGTDLPDPTVVGDLENNAGRGGAQRVLLSPNGDRAVAQFGMTIYAVTVPHGVGPAPTVVADPAAAAFPVRKLTEIGGEFPAWSPDGNTVYWGIGNVIAAYDLARAQQVDDSLKAAREARGGNGAQGGAGADSAARDSAHAASAYKPAEHRVIVTAARDIPQSTAVLRGARALTMKGHEIIENADIVIRNDRIVAVGKRGSVAIPTGAKVIDVSGKTIVPGFVDTHYHTQWLVPDVHVGQVWQYLAMLAYGVTTTRDPQTSTTDVLTYEDQVETGAMVGPRIYSTGPGVFSSEHIKTMQDARDVLKRYAEYYDTHTLKMYMSGNRLTREYIIMAAKELGLMPTTEGGLDFKLEMTHAMDGYPGVEHALPIAPLYDDVVNFWAKSGTTNTPTLIVSYGAPFGENYWFTNTNVHDDPKVRHFHPENDIDEKTRRRGSGAGDSPGPGGWFRPEEYAFPLHAAFSKGVVEAGGRVGVGSHGQFQGLGYQWEMWMIAMGGMQPYDVLRCATILGAEGIGMEKDLGSLEPGKMADLVVLDGNPLDNIRNTNTIEYVMKNGRLYDGNTLDEVYPRVRKLPHYLWQDKVPHVEAGLTGN